MGQKVNPHGIRVGVIKDWDSRWFASKKDFSDNLVEDHKIRTELKAQLKDAGVPKIEIERTVDPSTSAPRSAGCRGHRSSAGEPRYLPPRYEAVHA